MNDNQIFEGIPALDDQQGLEALLNQQAMGAMGIADPQPEPQIEDSQSQQTQQTDPQAAPQQTMYSSEQVAQIINSMREQQAQAQVQRAPQPQASAGGYSQQQITAINSLLARGVPINVIADYMTGKSGAQNQNQNDVQRQLLQRVQQVEQYLQQQEYTAERDAFIDKMNTFGSKFGLSEDDLVTFGNKALSMGINLTEVNDVEAVFRAVYPEQYAIRAQRIAGSNSSQIYGGASIPSTPQAQASKMEDAYVDAFMRQTMPNQYSQAHPRTK